MKQKKWLVIILTILMSIACLNVLACKPWSTNPTEIPPVDIPPAALQEGPETGVYYYSPDEGSDYLITLDSGYKFSLVVKGDNKSGTYKLDGEKLTLDFSYDKDNDIVATYKDKTITLTYKDTQIRFIRQENYFLNFEANGGSRVARQTVVNGKTAKKPDDPVRDGYAFIGWYADEELSTPFLFDTTLITENTRIYARWELKGVDRDEFLIRFDVNYAGGENPASMQTVNGHIFLTETPTRDEYVFKGWWVSMYGNKDRLSYRVTDEVTFAENMTVYALWDEEGKNTPVVNVTEDGISFEREPNVTYTVSVTGPEGFGGITDQQIQAVDIKDIVDFANAPGGDYEVTVTAIIGSNRVSTTRYFKNKALAKVSLFNVVEPSMLLYNSVEHAENYYITIECGDGEHKHKLLNNGNSTNYNFANCPMAEEGIKFTITAEAEGFEKSVSDTFVYNRILDKIEAVAFDEESEVLRWTGVPNATNYMLKILSNNSEEVLIDNGINTSYCLKDFSGEIIVDVYPMTKGYNSPEAIQYRYSKVRLASPKDVQINGMEISWTAVSDAVEYELVISDKTFTTAEAKYTLSEADLAGLEAGIYKIKIMAKASSPVNNSLYSDEVKISYLTMSGGITYSRNTVRWNHVLGASVYEVRVNEGEPFTVEGVNYANVVLDRAGDNTISVRIKTEDDKGEWVSTTVYAYTISFDSREGSAVENKYLARGDVIELPDTAKDGYDFQGWYNNPTGAANNGAKFNDGDVFEGTGDVVMYAYWMAASYNVTLVTGPGDDGSYGTPDDVKTTVKLTYMEPFSLDMPVSSDGTVVFYGWYSRPDGLGIKYTDETGNSVRVWDVASDEFVLYVYWAPVLKYTKWDNSTPDDPTDDYYAVTKGDGINLVSRITVPASYRGPEDTRDYPVQYISAGAFKSLTNLTSITIPNTITDMGASVFYGCKNLVEVNVTPVAGVPDPVFSSDNGVLLRTVPGVGEVQVYFYPQGKQGAYTIPDTVTAIPASAFAETLITAVTIPVNVVRIDVKAFQKCNLLQTVTFEPRTSGEDTVALGIGDSAFASCPLLTTVTFPAQIELLEKTTFRTLFAGSLQLESVHFDGTDGKYGDINGVIYDQTTKAVIFCPFSYSGTFEITSAILTIDKDAFRNCNKLEKVIIPNFITKINQYAFAGCSSLQEVIFKGGADAELAAALSVDNYAFQACTALTTVTFEENSNVTDLGSYAFERCRSLLTLRIPATMKNIKNNCFTGCESLTDVIFEDNGVSLTLGNNVFTGCNSLKEIYLPKNISFKLTIFNGVPNVLRITIDKENADYGDIDGVVFSKNEEGVMDTLAYYPKGREGAYTVPGVAADGSYNITSIDASIFENNTKLTSVTIPKSLTNINDKAFWKCYNLKEVIFETGRETELTLGQDVFNSCTSLTSFTFPEKSTTTGKFTLRNCTALVNVTLPTGLLTVGDYVFDSCSSLERIQIPDTVETIAQYAFRNTALKAIEIPKSVTLLGQYVFSNTKLTEVTIPANVPYIPNWAFSLCRDLVSIEIEEGVHGISYHAFNGCTSLPSITIPKSIEYIGFYAFEYCTSLTEVNFVEDNSPEAKDLIIGKTLTTYGESSSQPTVGQTFFASGLKSIKLPARLTQLIKNDFGSCASLESVEFAEDCRITELPQYLFQYCPALAEVKLSNNIQTINTGAFSTCTALTSIEIPNSVTKLMTNIFENCVMLKTVTFAEGATVSIATFSGSIFKNCVSLNSVTLPNNVTASSLGTGIFEGCYSLTNVSVNEGGTGKFSVKDNVLYYNGNVYFCPPALTGTITISKDVTSVERGAFQNCKNITSVILEDGRTTDLKIGQYAFDGCTSLTSVTLPDRLITIDNYAFQNCTALLRIDIPNTVGTIGSGAFKNCSSLTDVNFAEGNKQYKTLASSTFEDCVNLTNINFPSGMTTFNATYSMRNTGIVDLVIPSSLTSMNGTSLFANCHNLRTVTFTGDSLGTLGCGHGFENCENLTTVNFFPGTKKLTTLATYLFANCTSLAEITLPDSLATYNANVFQNTGLKSIVIPAPIKTVPNYMFADCTQLSSIVFADTSETAALTTINTGAFQNTAITEIRLPDSVTGGFARVFEGCKKLKEVTIPKRLFEKFPQNWANMFSGVYTVNTNGSIVTGDPFYQCFTVEKIHVSNDLYMDVDGVVFNTQVVPDESGEEGATKIVRGDTLVRFPIGRGGTYTIPEGVTKIADNAFLGCSKLTKITIPNTVTYIGMRAFDAIQQTNLTITDENLEQTRSALAQIEFLPGGEEDLEIGDSTKDSVTSAVGCVFRNTSITDLVLPARTAYMTMNCFQYNKLLKKMSFEEGAEPRLTVFNKYVFSNCTSLAEIEIPDSITDIRSNAFDYTAITTLYIPAGVNKLNETGTTDSGSFQNCLSLTDVTFDEKSEVTVIGSYTFSGCTSLRSVTLSSNLETIKSEAFAHCTALTSIELKEGLTTINNRAFYQSGLESAVLPSSVTTLEGKTFEECKSLESVTFGMGITSFGDKICANCTSLSEVNFPATAQFTALGRYMFQGCTSLTSIELPDYIDTIGEYAFENTGLTEIVIPGNVKVLGSTSVGVITNIFSSCKDLRRVVFSASAPLITRQAFMDCTSLSEVVIPEGVTDICGNAFKGCTSLESVKFPYSLLTIRDFAFQNCSSLKEIEINEGLLTIGNSAFLGTALTKVDLPVSATDIGTTPFPDGIEITLPESDTLFYDEYGVRYGDGGATLELAPASLSGEYVVPENVTSIANNAFKGTKITGIKLPESLTTIGLNAFQGATLLESIGIPSGVTTIGNYTFEGCTSLRRVVLPDTLSYINMYAFQNCALLQDIDLPETLISINNYAFTNCTSLQHVYLAASITTLGTSAFSGCTSLTDVEYHAQARTMGASLFAGSGLTEITIPSAVTTLNASIFSDCKDLAKVVFEAPGAITSIGPSMFKNCVSLTEIDIPDNNTVRTIGANAFEGCVNLARVGMPTSALSTIGASAFKGCKELKSIIIPTTITGGSGMGASCFEGTGLTEITISFNTPTASVTTSSVFAGCTDLRKVILLNCTNIGTAMFDGCTSLTEIFCPQIKTINANAFRGCSSLKGINIPLVTTINENAFEGCTSMSEIVITSQLTTLKENVFKGWRYGQTIKIYGIMTKPDGWVDDWKQDSNARVEGANF